MTQFAHIVDKKHPRILVTVRGGVAEVFKDGVVDVFLLDYDNEPDGVIPPEYLDLINSR